MFIKSSVIFLLFLLLSTITCENLGQVKIRGAIQASYYVDPVNGDDNNNGASISSAFKSIAKAQRTVRTINRNMTGDIIIYLRGGTYYIDNTINFVSIDSGTNGYNIIYKAFQNEAPVISGGKQITGWILYDASKNIYKASVDASMDFRQIYVNGKRAVRARTPNLSDSLTFADYYKTSKSVPFTVGASEISNWNNMNHIECVWFSHWHHKRAHIAGYIVNGDSATLKFMSPESNSQVLNHFPNDNDGGYTYYYFENAYEFIDSEDEWYLDSGTHTLYYKPYFGEDMSRVEVVAPVVENIVRFAGLSNSYSVHHIQFYGVTFECSNWVKPNSTGYLNWQSGLQLETDGNSTIPGMVQIDNANNLRFEHDTFRNSGAHGLVMVNNTFNNIVIGNVFTDLAGGGIYINSFIGSGTSSNDSISNNLIENVGQNYTDCVPILAANVANTIIIHNLIHNSPYTGISLGWSWDDTDQGCYDNEVSYNKIYNVMQLQDDGGGIYSLGRMPNGNFHHNYIYNIKKSKYSGGYPFAGIYLDNGSCYKTVENNVISKTVNSFFAANAPNHDNIIQNNFSDVFETSISSQNTFNGDVFVSNANWPSAALEIMNTAGLEPAYQYLTLINENSINAAPKQFILYQNYPNPWNPATVISWQLAVGSFVTLKIYDLLGREVRTLVNEPQAAGNHSVQFAIGNMHLASGVYLYRIQAGEFVQTKKMLILK
jgi:hypothetical protein